MACLFLVKWEDFLMCILPQNAAVKMEGKVGKVSENSRIQRRELTAELDVLAREVLAN
jgi:hypothetical protein